MARILKIKESSREIDVVHETDVLVVGSGPGGLAAAIGAILDSFPGKPGYSLYFGGIVFKGLLGTLSAWRLNVIVSKREV